MENEMSLLFVFLTHSIMHNVVLTGDGHYLLLIRSRVFTWKERAAHCNSGTNKP